MIPLMQWAKSTNKAKIVVVVPNRSDLFTAGYKIQSNDVSGFISFSNLDNGSLTTVRRARLFLV